MPGMGFLDRLKALLGGSVESLEDDLEAKKRERRAVDGKGSIDDIRGPSGSEQSALDRAREAIREAEIQAGDPDKPKTS